MTGPQRRSRLLDVGRTLFAERGVDATSVEDVAARVEHLLSARLGHSAAWAGLYAQALVGQGSLVGQWWLDHPAHDKAEVAARLVDLAWLGLSGLHADPVLVTLEVPAPRPVSRPPEARPPEAQSPEAGPAPRP